MAIILKQTDNVQIKQGGGAASQVFIIQKKDGTVMWQKVKPVAISCNSSQVTVTQTTTAASGSSSSSTLTNGNTLYVKAGEKTILSATPKAGFTITSVEGGTYDLSNVSTLSQSSFTTATYKVQSTSTVVTSYSVSWNLGAHVTISNGQVSLVTSTNNSFTFTLSFDAGYIFNTISIIDSETGEESSAQILLVDTNTYKISNISSSIIVGITAQIEDDITGFTMASGLFDPNNNALRNGNSFVDINTYWEIVPFTAPPGYEYLEGYELYKIYNNNSLDGSDLDYISLPSYVALYDSEGNSIDPTEVGFWEVIYDANDDEASCLGVLGISSSYISRHALIARFYSEPSISLVLDALTNTETLANEENRVPTGISVGGSKASAYGTASSVTIQNISYSGSIGSDGNSNSCWSGLDRLGQAKVLYGRAPIQYMDEFIDSSVTFLNNSRYCRMQLPSGVFAQWVGYDILDPENSNNTSLLSLVNNCSLSSGVDDEGAGWIQADSSMSADDFNSLIYNGNVAATNQLITLPLGYGLNSSPLVLCGVDYLSQQNRLLRIVFENCSIPVPVYVKLLKAGDFDNSSGISSDVIEFLRADGNNSTFWKLPTITRLDPETLAVERQSLYFDLQSFSDYGGCLVLYSFSADLETYNSENGTSYTGFSYGNSGDLQLNCDISDIDGAAYHNSWVLDARTVGEYLRPTCLITFSTAQIGSQNESVITLSGIEFS